MTTITIRRTESTTSALPDTPGGPEVTESTEDAIVVESDEQSVFSVLKDMKDAKNASAPTAPTLPPAAFLPADVLFIGHSDAFPPHSVLGSAVLANAIRRSREILN